MMAADSLRALTVPSRRAVLLVRRCVAAPVARVHSHRTSRNIRRSFPRSGVLPERARPAAVSVRWRAGCCAAAPGAAARSDSEGQRRKA